MQKRYLAVLLFLLFLPSVSRADFLRVVSGQDGLVNSSVLSLAQDYRGMVWIGTCEGLNVWNGREMSVFRADSTGNALSGNLIEKIVPIGPGRAWIVTDYGLNLLHDGRSEKCFDSFRGMYKVIMAAGERSFVITRGGHCYEYDSLQEDFLESPSPFTVSYSSYLSSSTDDEGKLWILSSDGIYSGTTPMDVTKVYSKDISFAVSDRGESLFIDGNGILYYYDGTLPEQIFDLSGEIARHGKVSDIIRDGKDYIVAFQFDGVIRLKESGGRFELERLPVECGVFDLMKDRYQDIVWMATDGYGLYMYARSPFTFTAYTELGVSSPVRAVCKDPYGDIWIGAKGDGIVRIGVKGAERVQSSISDQTVYALTVSRRGLIWIGTEAEGIDYYSFKDKRFHSLGGDVPEELMYIHHFWEQSADTLWAATVGKGVFRLVLEGRDTPRIREWKKLDPGPLDNDSDFFFSMSPSPDGSLWIGSRGSGLIKYCPSEDSYRVFKLEKGLSKVANDVWAIESGDDGSLWLGTGYGLLRMDSDGEKIEVTPVKGLVHEIRPDNYGNLWMGTNRGLVRYNPRSGMMTRFGYSYGLPFTEFSDGASMKDNNGNLYFGGTGGMIKVSVADSSPMAQFSPELRVISLDVDGKMRAYNGEKVVIKPREQLVGAEVLAVDHIDGENYHYYYNISELGDRWIETDSRILFPAIRPGDYNFCFKYLNADTGVESEVINLKMEIKAPFYATSAAFLIYVLIAAGLSFATIALIEARRRKKQAVREKELEAQRERNLRESQLRLLRSFVKQMELPLSMLSVPCQKILDYRQSDQYVKSCADKIIHYNTRAGHTIKLLSDLSVERPDAPEAFVFSPSDMLSELLDTYDTLAAESQIVFVRDISPSMLWNASPTDVISLADLLLTDAFLHAENGRNVTISCRQTEPALLLEVVMDGLWPNPRDVEKWLEHDNIMGYLQQSSDSKKMQDAMRLAVCQKRAWQMGGSMKISALDGRTSFLVSLPRVYGGETAASARALPTYETAARSILTSSKAAVNESEGMDMRSMLLLSAKQEIVSLVKDLFADSFRLTVVGDPVSFRASVEHNHPDIVVCEWLGHSEEIGKLIREFKENKLTLKIPVIMLSDEQADLPVEAWISLPLSVKALKYAVDQNLRRVESLQAYFNSSVSVYTFSEGRKLHREDRELLEKLYATIRAHLQEPELTTGFIASEMNMSVRNLYTRLSGIINITPSSIIREYRLAYAAQLLLKTKFTVDEIIYSSGFSNRGTFFKNFTERYGCTPKAYRRENQ